MHIEIKICGLMIVQNDIMTIPNEPIMYLYSNEFHVEYSEL